MSERAGEKQHEEQGKPCLHCAVYDAINAFYAKHPDYDSQETLLDLTWTLADAIVTYCTPESVLPISSKLVSTLAMYIKRAKMRVEPVTGAKH